MSLYILSKDPVGTCCTCAERVNVCDTCVPVTECPCQLGVDGGLSDTIACYAYGNGTPTSPVTSDVSTVNQITVTANSDNAAAGCTVGFSTKAGTVSASIAFTYSGNDIGGVSYILYDCNGAEISREGASFGPNPFSGTFSHTFSVSIPSDGGYIIAMRGSGNISGAFPSSAIVVISASSIVFNPTFNTDYVCPKMLLPPLTESTGNWYTDLSDAQSAIDIYVLDCVCYSSFENESTGTYSTSQSFSGGNISISETSGYGGSPAGSGPEGFQGYYSVSLDTTAQLSYVWSYTSAGNGNPKTGKVIISAYNNQGVQVWFVNHNVGNPDSGTFISPSLPPGRYIVLLLIGSSFQTGNSGNTETTSITATLTPSAGSMYGPYNAQALYHVGLDCPARLDC